jgi:kynureninase
MPPDGGDAHERDRDDPLGALRDRFHLPDGAVYLDGNSLGPVSADAAVALDRAVDQWRTLGIRAWTEAEPSWFTYGERLGGRLAPLVGADPVSVVAANSTTVNLHALLATFLPRAAGEAALIDERAFPTDRYALVSQLRLLGRDPADHLRVVDAPDGRTLDEAAIADAMADPVVGLALLPSVQYRSGRRLDLERLGRAAREHDVLLGVDLSHSIGVVPHALATAGVDFAVWCSYKYLNAGPGAVAGLYVAERHHDVAPALSGWWGHEKATQFEMRPDFTPAVGAGAWQLGTVPVLSAAPLWGALATIEAAGVATLREKSVDLTAYLIELTADRLAEHGVTVGTPRDPARRGGHVALEHPEAARLSLALRDRGVVVDHRPPDILRVCPAPLYTRFEDVLACVETLESLLESGAYERYDPSADLVT